MLCENFTGWMHLSFEMLCIMINYDKRLQFLYNKAPPFQASTSVNIRVIVQCVTGVLGGVE